MKRLRHIIGFSLIMLVSSNLFGQQDIQMSQQHFSRININPASTGFSNYANAFFLAREQWAGFEGSPRTFLLNLQGYVKDIKSGVGLSVLSDKVGHNTTFNFKFTYAFHAQVGEEAYISFGLSAGMLNRRLEPVYVEPGEQDPELIDEIMNGRSVIRPDVDFGISFATPSFAVGISATHLTRYLYKNDDWFKVPLHTYFYTEYTMRRGESFYFTPRAQAGTVVSSYKGDTLTFTDRLTYQYELGFTMGWKDKFWFGFAYRNADALTGQVGVNITPNLRLGYSYDFKLGNTFQNTRNYGSHEIILNWRMKLYDDEDSESTPRFFD